MVVFEPMFECSGHDQADEGFTDLTGRSSFGVAGVLLFEEQINLRTDDRSGGGNLRTRFQFHPPFVAPAVVPQVFRIK